MPITYTFDPDEWLVEVQYKGHVSVAEIRASLMQMLDEGLFKQPLRLLAHLRGIEPKMTYMDMTVHGDWRKGLPRFSRMALVVNSDFEYGVARQFFSATDSAGSAQVGIFRTLPEARNWLGLR